MVTIVIRDSGESSVIRLTYQNLYNEIKNIPRSKIIVDSDWVTALERVDTKYVCFVEPDCLVSSGYFESMLGLIKKNARELSKFAVFSPATAVNNWAIRFYGYNLGNEFSDGLVPNRGKKFTKLPYYTVQVAYIPGSIIKTDFIKKIVKDINLPIGWYNDLVYFSAQISTLFWQKNWMIYLAPNSTYVTTEDYVNDIAEFGVKNNELVLKFKRESI